MAGIDGNEFGDHASASWSFFVAGFFRGQSCAVLRFLPGRGAYRIKRTFNVLNKALYGKLKLGSCV
jgi:hypothetical protein